MKKIILTLVTALSIVACKKNETASLNENLDSTSTSENSSMITADSAYTSVGTFPTLSRSQTDSAITALKNTAVVKIEELKEEKELLTEKVAKEMDSASRIAIISEIKIAQKKIDSVKGKIATSIKKEKVAPKIIRETKIVYKETPKINRVEAAPRIVKEGQLEISVKDLETAQDMAKEQVAKYDGVVKNEQISTYEDNEYIYLKVTVPLEKSEYLIQDLENYVGTVVSRNIEITGQEYAKNSICNLEITLVNNSERSAIAGAPKSFGGRTLGAVGSGWNVIEEIFLFILPFWPLFLIGAGIYYFVKKKRSEKA